MFAVVHATLAATIGIISLAAGLAGHLFGNVGIIGRGFLFLAALLLLAPLTQIGGWNVGLTVDVTGAVILAVIVYVNWQFGGNQTVPKPMPADA